MADNEFIANLKASIYEGYRLYNNDPVKKFLPEDRIEELVTLDTVKSAFQSVGIEDTELFEFILRDARRLFLILVTMTGPEAKELSLLHGLHQDGVKDSSLPITIGVDKRGKSYGYCAEGEHTAPHFYVFNHWGSQQRLMIELFQWHFLAPLFGSGRFRSSFSSGRVLPYLDRFDMSTSSGFFGEVSKVEIHKAHITGVHHCPEVNRSILSFLLDTNLARMQTKMVFSLQ